MEPRYEYGFHGTMEQHAEDVSAELRNVGLV